MELTLFSSPLGVDRDGKGGTSMPCLDVDANFFNDSDEVEGLRPPTTFPLPEGGGGGSFSAAPTFKGYYNLHEKSTAQVDVSIIYVRQPSDLMFDLAGLWINCGGVCRHGERLTDVNVFGLLAAPALTGPVGRTGPFVVSIFRPL